MKIRDSFFSDPRPKTGLQLHIYKLLMEKFRPQNPHDQKGDKKGDNPKRDPYANITNSIKEKVNCVR